MVTIFHISDLHIVTSAHWRNLRRCILREARGIEGEKLLVVTGDFHNFGEGGYEKAEEFLKELIADLGIEPDKDVFLVPGNHDVGSPAAMKPFFKDDSWEYRQESETEWLKNHNSADKNYARHVAARLEAYTPYCAFARRLGVYPDGAGLSPASVHVRCWRGRLNLLHLNTTLIARGEANRAERLDILSATSREIWQGQNIDLPALALGHNSYYDLDAQQQTALKPPLRENRVCAYLCGDTHAEETDANRQHIRLDYGYTAEVDTIPNMVCVKGAADENDKFSNFGLYLHEWDEPTGAVTLRLLRWLPDRDQTDFRREDAGGYTMPHRSPDDTRRELERLREELKKKDGAPPPETEREKEARALWSAGREEDALAVLRNGSGGLLSRAVRRLAGWVRPLTILQPAPEPDENPDEARKRRVRGRIDELLLQIDILKSKGLNRDTIPQIRACYEECVKLAEAYRVSVYVLYDYASFLYNLNDYPPAIEAAHWLLEYYERENEPEKNQAALKNLLGNLFLKNNQMKDAEPLYREALAIYRRLAETNPAAYEPKVAMTCNNLGCLLDDMNRKDEAEEQYRKALGIYRRLAEANPAAYEPDVAQTRNNLGLLLSATNRMDEAEEQYREALSISRRLAETNPAAYEPDVAGTRNNLGTLLYKANRMDEAEKQYREALDVYRRLAEANPAAYEPYVATTRNNLANLLQDTNRMDEAEEQYRKALGIYRRLAEANPAAYEPYVATTRNNLANLLKNTNRMDEAEEQYREALAIRRRLAVENPAAYEPDVAATYNNLGNLLWHGDYMENAEAEILLREALGIYRRLAVENPAAYEPDVAATVENLAILYAETNQQGKAEKHFHEALAIYRRLAEANPAAYEPDVAMTCFNLGQLLRETSRKAEAKPLFEEAARLWDKYPHFADRAQNARSILNEFFGPEIRPWG